MEKDLVSMSQQFSGLPMEDLIGAPLNAAAKANAAMALTQTKFLLETCFTKCKKEETSSSGEKTITYSYNPIMIEMSLERGVIAYEGDTPQMDVITTKFNLPLLTIIPINSLGINSVDVGFEMEVKSSFSETEHQESQSETSEEASLEGKLGWGVLSVSVKGTASYSSKDSATHDTHYEKSNSAKYTINVHAGQLPVPKGVNTIIEAFTQNIQPIELPSVKQNEKKEENNNS